MKDITHKGVVLKSEENVVSVKIISKSACSECHAKGVCGVDDSAEKIIEVKTADYANYAENDDVMLSITQKSTIFVTFMAYILPSVLILTLIIAFNVYGVSDAIAGLASLAMVFIYFVVLFLFKKKLNKRVDISIRHIA